MCICSAEQFLRCMIGQSTLLRGSAPVTDHNCSAPLCAKPQDYTDLLCPGIATARRRADNTADGTGSSCERWKAPGRDGEPRTSLVSPSQTP